MKTNNFCGRTRREFLWQTGGGFTGVAMAGLMGNDGFLASQAVAADGVTPFKNPLAPKDPHFVPKAKNVSDFVKNEVDDRIADVLFRHVVGRIQNAKAQERSMLESQLVCLADFRVTQVRHLPRIEIQHLRIELRNLHRIEPGSWYGWASS